MDYEVDITTAVKTYADMVYRLAKIHTGGAAEVDDIFQNIFLKLYQHQNSIKSEEHLKAWLIRVTINECKSQMTTSWKKKTVNLNEALDVTVEEKQDYSDVTEAVLQLPVKYRDVIHLFYYEDLAIKDIASILQMSEGAIKTRLKRGRELLHKKLKGEYE